MFQQSLKLCFLVKIVATILSKLYPIPNNFHASGSFPPYHRTDQKIKVHVLTCLVGLILTALLFKKVQENHIAISPSRMPHELSKVRESLIMEISGCKGKPRARRKLEEMDDQTFQLYKLLSI